MLDTHTDAVHGRTVFTLGGRSAGIRAALATGAAATIEAVDLPTHAGAHPHIGAIDVCPIVYADPAQSGQAAELALQVAERLAALELPVFLYGELASSGPRRERHYFRRGGLEELRARMAAGELAPDLGPDRPHPTAGAVLVTARPPMAAFNVEVEGIGMEAGREIAAEIREAGGGMEGVRALAIQLESGRVQISTNVHDPFEVTLRQVVEAVHRCAVPLGGRAAAAELIGLIPEESLAGYPEEVPIRGFDPAERTIQSRLARLADSLPDPGAG